MHRVEQYINGDWVVVVEVSDRAAAVKMANAINGIVIPDSVDSGSDAACYIRLDWLECNCGWFCAADEYPR